MYSRLLCTNWQAVAQTVIDTFDGDPAIVLAHVAPLVNKGDATIVRTLLEALL